MIVAMAKDAPAGRQLSRDIIEFDFQLSGLTMTQRLAAQAAKVMFKKEIQLPGQLGFVKGQPARD